MAAPSSAIPIFPNYTQVPQRVPQIVWYIARIFTVGTGIGVILTLFIRPDDGLYIFWRLIVPILPILFFVAPGLWRNVCPMAALNQTPRLFRFSLSRTPPAWLRDYAYIIGIVMFFVIVPSRKTVFNSHGWALGLLLIYAFSSALLGGYFFKGKSGWCSSICPLLPVQRLYGQTPFVQFPNNHCKPCVGCAKNCYDFNPAVANMADQYDKDRHYAGYRKFFAGAFPGMVLAFYTLPSPPEISVPLMYELFALYMIVSLGLYFFFDTFVRVSTAMITTLFGAIALNTYYLFNIPNFAATIEDLSGLHVPDSILLLAHFTVLLLTLTWIFRTFQKEILFMAQAQARPNPLKSSAVLKSSLITHQSKVTGHAEVKFAQDGRRILAEPGTTLLEVAEDNDLQIEVGCRMGVCGADPVAILDGMQHLSPPTNDEKTTLERLGFADNTRMACCARVHGSVSVSLKPERESSVAKISTVESFHYDASVEHVVIIGNGIAGVTTADHIRRRHPICEIQIVAREHHHLYNRMGLSRLIYGRSAMQGLYLMPESWYDDYRIECLLNTFAVQIDRENRYVILGDGGVLPYDRLILATGSSSYVPNIKGYGLPGSFVLREADDAIAMRAYAQRNYSRSAVIAGGGLLGLEAAYALLKLGLEVRVLERGDRLMRRQLDSRGSFFLHEYLTGLGMEILTEAEADVIIGQNHVQRVRLKDGRDIQTDILLVAAGIRPNAELAKEAGLAVNQGVLVDYRMRTSDVAIFAAGDVAEHRNQVYGLWQVAVEQAQVAAINAVGGEAEYTEVIPVTMLKVAGIDLMSIGKFEATEEDEVTIRLEDTDNHRYRKLVLLDNRIIGAILIGYPREATGVRAAIEERRDMTPILDHLRQGHWDMLRV